MKINIEEIRPDGKSIQTTWAIIAANIGLFIPTSSFKYTVLLYSAFGCGVCVSKGR